MMQMLKIQRRTNRVELDLFSSKLQSCLYIISISKSSSLKLLWTKFYYILACNFNVQWVWNYQEASGYKLYICSFYKAFVLTLGSECWFFFWGYNWCCVGFPKPPVRFGDNCQWLVSFVREVVHWHSFYSGAFWLENNVISERSFASFKGNPGNLIIFLLNGSSKQEKR
jgi:hypothetical protein